MKTLIRFGIFSGLAIMLTLSACDLLKGKNDDCDATNYAVTEEPIIYLNLKLGTLISGPDAEHIITRTYKTIFSGTIMKVYCSGKESGRYAYDKVFYPAGMPQSTLYGGFFLEQPYQYKFQNDLDYVIVIGHLKMYFSDGKIYEDMEELTQKYFFTDIRYSLSGMGYYVEVNYPTVEHWVEVSY